MPRIHKTWKLLRLAYETKPGRQVDTNHTKGRRSRFEMRLLLTAALSAILLSSAAGQTANQAQVGREVSRTQRPAQVQTGPAQTALGAPLAELPQREEYG